MCTAGCVRIVIVKNLVVESRFICFYPSYILMTTSIHIRLNSSRSYFYSAEYFKSLFGTALVGRELAEGCIYKWRKCEDFICIILEENTVTETLTRRIFNIDSDCLQSSLSCHDLTAQS